MDMLREQIQRINTRLMDSESKRIFQNRLMFSLTSDYCYIGDLQSLNRLKEGRQYILWGRGYWAKEIITCYPGVRWVCICDNNCSNNDEWFEGIKVISPSQMKEEYIKYDVVIATRKYWRPIEEQLKSMGFAEGQIINLGRKQEMLAEKIYFDLPYLKKSKDEVFVDGGCYDGATMDAFIHWANNDYKKIYAFEPDSANAKKCEDYIKQKNIRDVEVCNYALTDKHKTVWFNEMGSPLSGADEKGSSKVVGVALQDFVLHDRVTFIKLDIEGMESEALAEEIIIRHKPQMAVSVYHKREDIWRIPFLLLQYNPNYRFYLRHYSIGIVDTVLYALA